MSLPFEATDIRTPPSFKRRSSIGVPLIDGDFGKSVRILVPESCARLPIAEGPRALQHPTAAVALHWGGSMAALSPVMALLE